MHHPKLTVARGQFIDEHQERHPPRACVNQGDGIGPRAIGDHEAVVGQRGRAQIAPRCGRQYAPLLKRGPDQALHLAGRAFAQPLCPVRHIQPQHIIRPIHPDGIPAPRPGRAQFERLHRRGLQTVDLCLRPADDKRAPKARFHNCSACLVYYCQQPSKAGDRAKDGANVAAQPVAN